MDRVVGWKGGKEYIHANSVQEKLGFCSAHLEHLRHSSHRIDCMSTMKYHVRSMDLEELTKVSLNIPILGDDRNSPIHTQQNSCLHFLHVI